MPFQNMRPLRLRLLAMCSLALAAGSGVTAAQDFPNRTNAGSEVVAGSPEQLAALIKAEIGTMGKVIKDAGIKLE